MQKKLLLSTLVMVLFGLNAWAQVPSLKYLSTYSTNVFDEGAAEIVVYDSDNNQLYFTNAGANSITILDFSNPAKLEFVADIDCNPYGDGVNSVAYSNGYIAVAVQGKEAGDNGEIVFFDKDGTFIAEVVVGFLPDMVTFSPDGNMVLVACEGEPSDDYLVDPKGSVTIIDVSGGITGVSQANVTDLGFDQFQDNLPEGVRVFGPTIGWNDDFEVTEDSLKLYNIINYGVLDTLFFEDFENTTTELANFDTFSRASNKNWIYKSFGGDHYAEINGFGGNEASEDWLITPAFDKGSYDKIWFSFEHVKRFGGDGLTVWVSNDYDGLIPENATWNEITNEINWTDGSSYNAEITGGIDITQYAGSNTYVAFFYQSNGGASGDGSVYQIDNIAIVGMQAYNGLGWYFDEFSGDHFAEGNGFKSNNASFITNSWMVFLKLDVSTYQGALLSFTTAANFSGGTMEILISNHYNGGIDPAAFTWDTLTNLANLSSGGYNEVASGDIDISAWAAEPFYLALHLTGTGNGGGSMTWQFDDFVVKAKALNVARNIEPEYVTVSDDSKTAYVFCQENNAVAVVDLTTKSITALLPLGYKNHNVDGNGLDASNKDDKINIATWPVNGMYLPDAAAYKTIGGKGYLLTANEGDAREYIWESESESECYRRGGLDYDDGECLAYIDEIRIEDIDLDETAFPNAATLQLEENLGRLKVTTTMGDTDGDGDYDELYSFGARSFTIWDPLTGAVVFDSGDDFEQWAAKYYPDGFNATNDENGFDDRSDDKGPEPEAITTGDFRDSTYAFIGLERMGGIMVYNITDPKNARIMQYTNNRDFSDTVNIEAPWAGDLGPECVVYIKNSDVNKDYVVVASEVSGSISVYEFSIMPIGLNYSDLNTKWELFPNPATNNIVNSTKVDDYTVYDLTGRVLIKVKNTKTINLSSLAPGSYLIGNAQGNTKVIIK